jgi:hypothetical protein
MKHCHVAMVTTIASLLAGSVLGCSNSSDNGGSGGASAGGAHAGGAAGAAGSLASAGASATGGSPASNAGATGDAGSSSGGTSAAGTSSGGTSSGGTSAAGTSNGGAAAGLGGASGAAGAAGSAAGGRGGNGGGTSGAAGSGGGGNTSPMMSFFVTSRGPGNGGNLGGLDGADAFCKMLATNVSAALGAKIWHAYLSTSTVNARTRIGDGPWRNAAGVIVANNLTDLHDQMAPNAALNATWPVGDTSIALDEHGNQVPITGPNVHDILTGSTMDGNVLAGNTCNDWTSNSMTVTAQVGHTNRMGNGIPSWNSTHATTGCAQPTAPMNQAGTVSSGGGRGSIYCFALP